MAELVFSRVDFRLIHGQVITKWIRQTQTNKIVIIDDELSKDAFLLNIYTMAAPPGFPVIVYSVEEAVKNWREGTFTDGKIFILFKTIDSVYKSVIGGLPINKLQIGGLGFGAGRKNVHGAISLNKEDADKLSELSKKNVKVYFQQVPDEKESTLGAILDKYSF